MKKTLLLFACSLTIFASAQNTVNVTTQQYQLLKQNHQLDVNKHYVFTDSHSAGAPVHFKNNGNHSPSSICSCMVTLDTTFSVVPFTNGVSPDYRNDDGSSPKIGIPFTFNYYGVNYDSLYINNNGNVSFSNPYYNFTPYGFPDSTFNMIAAFWGDVDTRDSSTLSGLVYYKITPTALIVKWEHVGYYTYHNDKLNTFQLILTDGTDPLLPAGDNVGFCYGDMQWTTGDASSGIAGFGGSAATVGVNKGDGVNYFQVGQFDTSGVAFDGPYGNIDQVDWLDNQGIYFNVSTTGNIPPIIINNNICDTIDVYTGDTTHSVLVDSVRFTIGVATPEINQSVNVTISSPDAANLNYILTKSSATYKEYACSFKVLNLATGLHYVNVSATDDGTPAMTTNKSIIIRSHYDASLATGITETQSPSSISVYPNPADNYIVIKHNFNASSSPTLSIANVVGQNILHTQLSSQEQTIDISKLSKGIYFATIISKEGKSKTIKIVRK